MTIQSTAGPEGPVLQPAALLRQRRSPERGPREALEHMAQAFVHGDEEGTEVLATAALRTGATHFEIAAALLELVAQLTASAHDPLAASEPELRAQWVLCRLAPARPATGRRVLLFTERVDSLSLALRVVAQASGDDVRTAVTPDPARVVALVEDGGWDEVVVDHVTLRRSARMARGFLQPLLPVLGESHLVVTTSAFDDPEAEGRTAVVPRDLRRILAATGVIAEDPLGNREREVLRAVARGRSNDQIARQLEVSLSTVKTYLERIHAKLGSVDRASAVATAIRRGWI